MLTAEMYAIKIFQLTHTLERLSAPNDGRHGDVYGSLWEMTVSWRSWAAAESSMLAKVINFQVEFRCAKWGELLFGI